MAISIGIVDDQAHLIRSLKQNLSMFDEVEIMFEANNGEHVLKKLESQQPDILLMDIEMPIMNGIEATRKVKALYPNVKVIMLTVFDQEDHIFEAILAGASGYLLKDIKPHKVVSALEDVMEGGAPMSPKIAAKALGLIRNPELKKKDLDLPEDFGLTSRELEILERLALGESYQVTAEKLFISPKTVRKHIENIYQKLQVHSKVDAVKMGLKNQWF